MRKLTNKLLNFQTSKGVTPSDGCMQHETCSGHEMFNYLIQCIMDTNTFFCITLGVDGSVIDNICDEFDVDLTDDDVLEAIRHSDKDNEWGAGQYLLMRLYEQIVEEYDYALDKDKFDWDVSSPSYPDFIYDGQQITTRRQLDALVEQTIDGD